MATLSSGLPLRELARILHAAAAVGSGAGAGDPGESDGSHSGGTSPPQSGGGKSESELLNDLRELFDLLNSRGVSYLLVGGVALLRYVDGRNTDDIDLVMSVASLAKMPEIVISHRSGDFARGKFKSVRVDLLLTKNPLFRLVDEKHATVHQFLEANVRCSTVEGLILLKLYALPSLYREGNAQRVALYEGDITMLCIAQSPALAPLLETLRSHVTAGEHEELVNVLREIEQRVKRLSRKGQ